MLMIQLIYAAKGNGKTKRLLNMVNTEVKEASGTVVFIDDDKRYLREVDSQARFVDISEYGIDSAETLYGFLCGMYAQNYDIQSFYIDAFLKIVKVEPEELEAFFKAVYAFCDERNINIVFCVSAEVEKAPAFLKEWII
ncbi:MAG: hypothetical protein ACOX3W_05130 [Christensenellaceae bacterium]|jgi:hypothetical protein